MGRIGEIEKWEKENGRGREMQRTQKSEKNKKEIKMLESKRGQV